MYKDNTMQLLATIEGFLCEGAAAHAAVLDVLITHVAATLPIAAAAYRIQLVEAKFEAARSHRNGHCCE